MNIIFVLIAVFCVLVLLLTVLRKIKGVVITIVMALVLLVGFSLYVLFVPSSKISMWVTQNVVSTLTLDSKGSYSEGEVIWTWDIYTVEDTPSSTVPSYTEDISEYGEAISSFLQDRISSTVISLLDKDESLVKGYTLVFKDAVLSVDLSPEGGTVIIVKSS